MGMCTEVYINVNLKENIPKGHLEMLKIVCVDALKRNSQRICLSSGSTYFMTGAITPHQQLVEC